MLLSLLITKAALTTEANTAGWQVGGCAVPSFTMTTLDGTPALDRRGCLTTASTTMSDTNIHLVFTPVGEDVPKVDVWLGRGESVFSNNAKVKLGKTIAEVGLNEPQIFDSRVSSFSWGSGQGTSNAEDTYAVLVFNCYSNSTGGVSA